MKSCKNCYHLRTHVDKDGNKSYFCYAEGKQVLIVTILERKTKNRNFARIAIQSEEETAFSVYIARF
ncbi:MAG: hypothetical protein ACTSRB_07680 [Candidatus Helarchaeota archaeon]